MIIDIGVLEDSIIEKQHEKLLLLPSFGLERVGFFNIPVIGKVTFT